MDAFMLPLISIHVTGALLIPKLRSQFAEFLNVGSVERLRIFSSPTCVGLRYGRHSSLLEAFLGSWVSARFPYYFRVSMPLTIIPADLPAETGYGPRQGDFFP